MTICPIESSTEKKIMSRAGKPDALAPLAALSHIRPEKAFTPLLQQQVVAMARLGANVPGKLSSDDVRTVCRTLLYHVEHDAK